MKRRYTPTPEQHALDQCRILYRRRVCGLPMGEPLEHVEGVDVMAIAAAADLPASANQHDHAAAWQELENAFYRAWTVHSHPLIAGAV